MNGVTTESRRLAEFMKRSLDAISIKVDFDSMPGGDRLKRFSTCQFQLGTQAFGGGAPDGVSAMENFHSSKIGTVNFSCYRSDDFDRIYEQLRVMPDTPDRATVFAKLTALLDAHAPVRILPAADDVTLIGPRVQGFATNPYLMLPYYLFDVAAPGR
jgi:oligopeptide transport system substrate-binding protein